MRQLHHMQARVPVQNLGAYNPAEKNKVRAGVVFDTCVYDGAAGHSELLFLSTQQGAKMNDNSRTKTEADTNLQQAGTLPSNQSMLVKGVQVLYTPGMAPGGLNADAVNIDTLANDLYYFYEQGLLHLQIKGNDVLKDGPLKLFPGETGLEGSAAFSSSSAFAHGTYHVELINLRGEEYPLEWFTWNGGEVLTAKMLWPNGKVPMPSGLSGTVRLRLTGDIYEVK